MHDSDSLTSATRGERPNASTRDNCRAVLRYFRSHPTDVATVEDLAAFVRQRRESEDGTRIEISLHHSALPKLDDAGLLDYDARSNTARYRGLPSVEDRVSRIVGDSDSSV